MSRVSVLLFSATPSESGWNGYSGMPIEVQELVRQLTDASLLDLAEQCASVHGVQAVLYETEAHKISAHQSLPPLVQSKTQMKAPLAERIGEAVEAIYKADGSAGALVLLSPNPLFPLTYIQRAMELLHLEDDVVVTAMDENDSLLFCATRTFHPPVYSSIRSLTEAGAFVVPLPTLRSITDISDLTYLHHEIERKVLLAQPFPRRTLDVLKSMQRHNLIPEEL